MNGFGIYIHIPFCRGKCPYCDFYSVADSSLTGNYIKALGDELTTNRRTSEFTDRTLHVRKAVSLYVGGGTPSVLSGTQLSGIIRTIRKEYALSDEAEITVECNPSTPALPEFFAAVADSGVNRISLGLQSAVDSERKALGRRGGRDTAEKAVEAARNAGIDNISLDVMLGIPLQTRQSLKETLDFCLSENVSHISAYMLKLEEGTRFYRIRDTLELPGEDEVCDNYLFTCGYLSENGIKQYEISNFSKKGCESRHNMLYWDCREYLGVGAAAHSFINGKRFFLERSVQKFTDGEKAVFDSTGGSFEEYAMLRLRLSEGLTEKGTLSRFGSGIPERIRTEAKKVPHKYIISDSTGIRLKPEGFLISNSIISLLLTGE